MVERIAKASKVPFINAQRFEKEKERKMDVFKASRTMSWALLVCCPSRRLSLLASSFSTISNHPSWNVEGSI